MCWIFGGLHRLHVTSLGFIHFKAFVSNHSKAIYGSSRREVCFGATVGHKMGSLTNQLRLAGRDTAKRIFFRDRPSCFRTRLGIRCHMVHHNGPNQSIIGFALIIT